MLIADLTESRARLDELIVPKLIDCLERRGYKEDPRHRGDKVWIFMHPTGCFCRYAMSDVGFDTLTHHDAAGTTLKTWSADGRSFNTMDISNYLWRYHGG